MRKNLLEFLFGPAAVLESSQSLGEDVVKLFEEAAEAETEQMVANKKPLAAALKDMGISNAVVEGPQWCEIHCDDEAQYREHVKLLVDPDNMHKLAEKGWVFALCGDQAMSNEPPGFKIGFIELNMLGMPENKAKADSLETVLKNAQKFATTPLERDDDLNPVETDDKGSKDNQKGVGKAKDGADPEGKPKGASKKSESLTAKALASRMLDEDEVKCPECGSTSITHREKGTATTGAKFTCNACKFAWKAPISEATTCSAIPTTTASMGAPMMAGTNWHERLKRMKKRRGERTDEPRTPPR